MNDPPSEWKIALVAELTAQARAVVKSPVSSLPQQHRDVFEQALRNVLSTELAQAAYAEIADGFPTASGVRGRHGFAAGIDPHHPLFQTKHDTPCPEAWERVKELHSSLDIQALSIDTKLLHAYGKASVGSRAFQPRLLEMVAVALHQLAVTLYKLGGLPQHDDWPNPKPYPTLFYHACFQEHQQYPEGVADMVGYWAESWILGGVVLFDRGASGDKECGEIYFQSDRLGITYRLYALNDEQKQKLFSLLTDTSGLHRDVLPILGDLNNRVRVNPEDAVFKCHIYRDKWERPVLDWWEYPRRCVESYIDFPEILDQAHW